MLHKNIKHQNIWCWHYTVIIVLTQLHELDKRRKTIHGKNYRITEIIGELLKPVYIPSQCGKMNKFWFP